MDSPIPTIPQVTAPVVDLNDTIGAIEIGSLFGVFLFGIVTLQTFNYYDNYREDSWINKTLVAVIWLLEIGHTIGINFEVYRSTITLYGQPWLLVRFPGIAAVTVIGGAITLIAQIFFSLRLTKLLPRPYHRIGIIAIVISTARFSTSIYLTVEGLILTNITEYREKCQWVVAFMFISSALVDIMIAASMLYYLARQRKQVKRISRLLDRLVTYTIRTGLLTSVAAIAVILCFQLMPANFVWLGVYTFVAKLYSNSLLSALNARKELRADIFNSDSIPGDHFTMPDIENLAPYSHEERAQSFQPVVITMKSTMDRESPDLQDKPGTYPRVM